MHNEYATFFVRIVYSLYPLLPIVNSLLHIVSPPGRGGCPSRRQGRRARRAPNSSDSRDSSLCRQGFVANRRGTRLEGGEGRWASRE
jgi:hypothetical protein